MRAIVFAGAGGNEVVALQERPDPAPGAGEVLVSVRYAGVNPADVQQREGRYPAPPGSPPDVPGLEVSGVVAATGPGSRWSPGDRVFGLVSGGGLADAVLVPDEHVIRIPDRLVEHDASAVPEAFMTAHDAVATQSGLRSGEILLVHGAGGGVGGAAVQTGLLLSARVLAVVRSGAAAEAVTALGAEPVWDDGFAEQVRDLTSGAGADVIIELVGAPHFPDNVEALAQQGRIIVVGVGAGARAQVPLLTLMRKRATIRGTVLRSRSHDEKAAVVRDFERDVVPALAAGTIRPVVDSVFPADRAGDAFDRVTSRGKNGKVLLAFS